MKWFVAILMGTFSLSFANALACSCDAPDSVEEHINETDAIFYGTPVETHWIVSFDNGLEFLQSTKFRVYDVLKGDIAESDPSGDEPVFVYVRHEKRVDGNCGLAFHMWLYYEIFAGSHKGRLYSSSCAGTRPAPIPEYPHSWEEYRESIEKQQ